MVYYYLKYNINKLYIYEILIYIYITLNIINIIYIYRKSYIQCYNSNYIVYTLYIHYIFIIYTYIFDQRNAVRYKASGLDVSSSCQESSKCWKENLP